MKKKKGTKIRWGNPSQYLATLLAGLVISALVAWGKGFRLDAPGYEKAGCLSDAFFAAGAVIAGLGVLTWIGNVGFFDIMSFGVHNLVEQIPFVHRGEQFENYYDYKQKKDENRKGTRHHLLIVGAFFLVLAILCLGLYFNLPS